MFSGPSPGAEKNVSPWRRRLLGQPRKIAAKLRDGFADPAGDGGGLFLERGLAATVTSHRPEDDVRVKKGRGVARSGRTAKSTSAQPLRGLGERRPPCDSGEEGGRRVSRGSCDPLRRGFPGCDPNTRGEAHLAGRFLLSFRTGRRKEKKELAVQRDIGTAPKSRLLAEKPAKGRWRC